VIFWGRSLPGTRSGSADLLTLLLALASVGAATAIYFLWLSVANATTVAFSYLLIVLFVAASCPPWVAVTTSVVAMLAFSFFFLPPIGTFAIANHQDLVAWFAFLCVSLVGSRLSAKARNRQHQATRRGDELAQLFDLSQDVLRATEGAEAIPKLAHAVLRRFNLDLVAICLPAEEGFRRFEVGACESTRSFAVADLEAVMQRTDAGVEGARRPAPFPAFPAEVAKESRLLPLRLGDRVIGVVGVVGPPVETGTLDTLANLVAIAVERAHFLDERKQTEIARRSAELKSALLASVAHDLRTPLTAIRVAADNVESAWLDDGQRSEQIRIVQEEVERLSRLFQNILEMARIDAGAIAPERQWVHPPAITEAARSQVEHRLRDHRIETLDGSNDHLVRLDPRLISSALAHLLENAAQYSQPRSTITVSHELTAEGLLITVLDEGTGLAASDLPRLFDRFYRGKAAGHHRSGTGMGLAITRGLLAAECGRVWGENRDGGGAQFSMLVPVERRLATVLATA
jgi:two-component system sensor histidine kinase KdpD